MNEADEIRYECYDCGVCGVANDYGAAQTFFSDHADRGHEVELVNLSASTSGGTEA